MNDAFVIPGQVLHVQRFVQDDGRGVRVSVRQSGQISVNLVHQWRLLFSFRGTYIYYEDNDINRPRVAERVWERNLFHFDDVGKAMLTLFTVSTFEGWPG